MEEDLLNTQARYIKGVGPKNIQLLNKLGIKTVKDILFFFPRRHEDRSNILPLSSVKLQIGQPHTVKGTILSSNIFRTKTGLTVFQIAVSDGTDVIYATWYNQPYMKKYFKPKDQVILYGKVQRYRRLQINAPEYEIFSKNDEGQSIHMQRIVPIYPLVQNLRQRKLRSIAKICVDEFSGYVTDPLPTYMKKGQRLIDLAPAIRHIHFPASFAALKSSRYRLVFDEFFFLQIALALKKARYKFKTDGVRHNLTGELIRSFEKRLPFKLTGAQAKVIEHIRRDMESPRPMCRLLQGDVGSGKTIVAAYSVVVAKQSGYQAAIMAPTEILAEQHYMTLSRLLLPLGINVVLLTSGLAGSVRKTVLRQIKSGQVDVVVGTHALIQEGVSFNKLSLVIVDEQHKFGVLQRTGLVEKAVNPDILVMTATPIPRTLALTLYGDLDVSVIDQMPPGRMPVKTYWVGQKNRDKVYQFMRNQIKKGRQVFVVYPLIDTGSSDLSRDASGPGGVTEATSNIRGQTEFDFMRSTDQALRAAKKMYENFKNNIFSDLRVGLIHGRMSKEEKEGILKSLRGRDIDILVSTVVVEVGIDIPNASLMVVEHAERFGLAQLHQLRGRIGRSSHQSYCILIANARTEESKRRLQAMVDTQDGFKIAEEDLSIRGPGDFMGTRQHGIPGFRIGNIVTDIRILEVARQLATEVVNTDPGLHKPEHQAMSYLVKQQFGMMEPLGL